jgi:hypothetical protein
VSWLDDVEDRVNDLLVALERIADAVERLATAAERTVEEEATDADAR